MTTTSHNQVAPSGHILASPSSGGCSPQARITRSLLGYGVLAGPLYVTVSLIQVALRDGFDPTRHEWSLLANGPGGWVQVANLIVTGLMVAAGAGGFGRALRAGGGRSWAPRLLAVYGVGLIAAGVFRADPMNGFPAGAPEGPPAAGSVHGTLHLMSAGVGFLALVAAMFVLARHFHMNGHARRAAATAATGVAFLAGFAGVASGSPTAAVNLAFTAAVVLSWAWLSSTCAYLYQHTS